MGITSDPIQDRMGSWPRNVTASRPRAYLIFQPGDCPRVLDRILNLSSIAAFFRRDLLFLVIEGKQIPHSASELLTHKTASLRSER
jgi:hypothetical protein